VVAAGHSKWANIKHRKARVDAERMKAFAKFGRLIAAAAKVGGTDIGTNFRLADIVASARSANMPKTLIDNAIKRGGDPSSGSSEELWYEGTGPSGAAVMVQCFSDSKNRTRDSVRSAFTKNGGTLGGSGSVAFAFDTRGEVVIAANQEIDEDSLLADALDAGADDVEWGESLDLVSAEGEDPKIIPTATVLVTPTALLTVESAMKDAKWRVLSAEVVRRPNATVALTGEDAAAFQGLIEAIEGADDVEAVFHNAELPPDEDDNERA
jgi:YebC/PmpR family DNA-binding regulatory protein